MNMKLIEHLVRDYIDNYNIYATDENSGITNATLDRLEDLISSTVIRELGWDFVDGIYVKK